MPPAAKKAANRLGPAQPPAGQSQPPWAMVSADGTEMLYPQSAEQAREFLSQGATPVDSALWPWPAEVPLGDTPAEPPAIEPLEDSGGQMAPELQPAQPPAEPSAPVEGTVWHSCPTPAACWPLGLPDGCSYVTCQHGAWAIGD